MKFDDYKKLSPEGRILAKELLEIKAIVLQLRDGVMDLENEGVTNGPDKP